MSSQRTVQVDEIHYLGTDGEDHVAYRGDKVTVAAAGVEHFDWVQSGSADGRWAEFVRSERAAEKAAVVKPTEPPAAAKAAEK